MESESIVRFLENKTILITGATGFLGKNQIPYVAYGDYVAYNNEKGGMIEILKEDGIVDLDIKFYSVTEWISMKAMISSCLADAITYELWVGSDGRTAQEIYYLDLPLPIGKALFFKQIHIVKQQLGMTKDNAKQKEEETSRYLSDPQYYFQVNDQYMRNKLKVVLFPFLHRGHWTRISKLVGGRLSYKPQIYDINAPDLYIPFMEFGTYVVLAVVKMQGRFEMERKVKILLELHERQFDSFERMVDGIEGGNDTGDGDTSNQGKELFKVLREKWDTNFDSFISIKVAAISGDVSFENLGLKDAQLRELLWKEIDIIIHSAATTNFDGRYDVPLGTNTLGVLHVLGFAKECIKLQMLVHVSTAYVCGERERIIPEDAVFYTGKTIKTSSKLDSKEEQKLVEDKLSKLQAQNESQDTITAIMRDFGIQRARLYGWPNTYVFTKAMGEICLKEYKDVNVPLVTIRPAMVTSSYKEPFPGWIEGLRTVDGVIGAYRKGQLKSFLGSAMSILHLVS
ncbi:hypothetical protein FNV43_RR15460 [Rhamnella rubrinervis]|uniref:Fatty acyl-CoA reductase n=1 Tax=Rhamnella rubrinervis TaxID=2594499 RepID=A0A8K0E3F7_9ROSA|nr:hypothetical protein FNV43_RR15460 [Rhamnella rubrinervis]